MKPQNPINISLASAEDAHVIARLNLLFNGENETAEAIAARMSDPACVEMVILAKIYGDTVGFALVRVVPTILYGSPHAELTELYVMEEYRQRGIASALIAFAETLAAQKGARSILIQTGNNNTPALFLYRKNGYEKYDVTLIKYLK